MLSEYVREVRPSRCEQEKAGAGNGVRGTNSERSPVGILLKQWLAVGLLAVVERRCKW